MLTRISEYINELVPTFRFPKVTLLDIVEILILALIFYFVIVCLQKTKSGPMVKALLILGGLFILAFIFNMTTILWLSKSLFTMLAGAILVAFQPELRRIMKELGRKDFLRTLFIVNNNKEERFSDDTLNAVISACYEMGRNRTGALIVWEQNVPLDEYIQTGIVLDADISPELLINIFEHNTPLHDGAIVLRGNKVQAATCYLPLSASKDIAKDLGTRHRAAVGISEATDALTIVVSEETGRVSVAHDGTLERSLDNIELRRVLSKFQNKKDDSKKSSKEKKNRKEKKTGNEKTAK